MRGISFMSANFVARELDYHMTKGWGQGEKAVNARFEPPETFPERFEELLREVRAMGFNALDLWTAHLNPGWATEEHVFAARELLERHELEVASMAGGFGSTPEEFESACRLANTMNIEILGGMTPLLQSDRGRVVETLKGHGLKLAIENHPEKNPQEMLEKIGDAADGAVGTAVDTGWYGTHGYDAARAIRELGDHILHVHLKDVEAPGAHVTTRHGAGCVPIDGCVEALEDLGYSGWISVEHEPEDHDPTEDCRASRQRLERLLPG